MMAAGAQFAQSAYKEQAGSARPTRARRASPASALCMASASCVTWLGSAPVCASCAAWISGECMSTFASVSRARSSDFCAAAIVRLFIAFPPPLPMAVATEESGEEEEGRGGTGSMVRLDPM